MSKTIQQMIEESQQQLQQIQQEAQQNSQAIYQLQQRNQQLDRQYNVLEGRLNALQEVAGMGATFPVGEPAAAPDAIEAKADGTDPQQSEAKTQEEAAPPSNQ